MKIVIVTTGQPSTNPRMLKEYMLFKSLGIQVKVLYSFWVGWALQKDNEFFRNGSVNQDDFLLIGGNPQSKKFTYLVSRVLYKIRKIASCFFLYSKLLDRLLSRSSFFLELAAKKEKADIYIAHNLGALPAVIKAAKKNKANAGIDFEDHYSGQYDESSKNYRICKLVEDRYIPEISFSIAASPLIAERYKMEFPFLSPLVIHNVFSKQFLRKRDINYNSGEELKLIWFSQTVGKDRGLEEILKAMGICKSNISCTILGNCSVTVKNELLKIAESNGVKASQIYFLDPVAPDEVFFIAASHHVGLALEYEKTINRDICLTNKIFTYLLAGLAIIATDTSAQKLLLDSNKGVGSYFKKGDINQLAKILIEYQSSPEILKAHCTYSLKLASDKFNWEEEEKKLKSLIEKQF